MPTTHYACRCPNYQHTLHAGPGPCARIEGGIAAVCFACGGCKACRLYDEGALTEGSVRLAPGD